MQKKIIILSAISGTGHNATARALQTLLKSHLEVRVVYIHRILGLFNYIGERFYNFCLMRRKIGWIAPYHRLSKSLIRFYRPVLIAAIKRFFRGTDYDCIVSCIPWVNHLFLRALPDIPLVTVITDFCDSATHPWIQHKNQWLVCPTDKSERQAQSFGIPRRRIFRVSGNIISPGFYSRERPIVNRNTELERIGLNPRYKTVLLLYGGYGPDYMEDLVRGIDDWNFIVVWGKNTKRIEKKWCANIGYTNDIPYYMRLADLLVGKPGPGVVAEAVHSDLPLLVDAERGMLLPQEIDVLEWIVQNGLGVCFRSQNDFFRIMGSLHATKLDGWKENATKIVNRAVFETSRIIEKIVFDAS